MRGEDRTEEVMRRGKRREKERGMVKTGEQIRG